MAATRRPLIPQFSLRNLLVVMALLAVASFIMSLALREQAWAAGVLIGLIAGVVVFVVYAAIFGIAWLLAALLPDPTSKTDGADKLDDVARRKSPAASTTALLVIFSTLPLFHHAGICWAASGGSITLPIPTTGMGAVSVPPTTPKSSTGLTLTIDTVWVDSFGYRPVRIKIASTTGPLTADRVLTVRFRPKAGYSNRDSVVVTQSIEIPAGSTSATATLSVPQIIPMFMFEFDTFEDGQYIGDLSIPSRMSSPSWGGTPQGDSTSPVMLLLGGANKITPSFSNRPSTPESLYIGLPGPVTVSPGGPIPPAHSLIPFVDFACRTADKLDRLQRN